MRFHGIDFRMTGQVSEIKITSGSPTRAAGGAWRKMRAFEPERERAFQSSRHKRRALQTYWAGLTALVAYNALLVANFVWVWAKVPEVGRDG